MSILQEFKNRLNVKYIFQALILMFSIPLCWR